MTEDRDGFEIWAGTHFKKPWYESVYNRRAASGTYFYGEVESAWLSWQACQAHTLSQLDSPEILDVMRLAVWGTESKTDMVIQVSIMEDARDAMKKYIESK